jgi:NADH:ubiquinone oxidoreductase subunit E
MSPVVRIDETTYGRVRVDRIGRILKKYRSDSPEDTQVEEPV